MNPEKPEIHTDSTTQHIEEITRTMSGETLGAIGSAVTGEAIGPHPSQESAQVRHERHLPQEWNDIVELAGTLPVFKGTYKGRFLSEPRKLYHAASVDTLRERLSGLSNDELEELRYFGLGEIIRDLELALRDPAQKEEMTNAAAESLYAIWRSGQEDRLKPEHISLGIGGLAGFDGPIVNAFHNLPPHLQLLNDVLFWNQNERKTALQRGGEPGDYIHESIGILGNGDYVNGQCVPDIVAVALSGATLVVQRSLQLRGSYLAGQDPDFPADASAQQIIEHTDVDTFNLHTVAQRAAAIRLDEFNADVEGYIGLDDNGNVVFHGKRLPPSRNLKPAPMPPKGLTIGTPLHTRRLRCPALFVDALVPNIVDAMLGIIKKTDQLVREQDKPAGHP